MDTLPPEIIAMICAYLSRIPRAAARVAGIDFIEQSAPIGRADVINFAAEDGDIFTLQWTHARGFRTTACHRAANVETLQWLHAHGYNIALAVKHAVESNNYPSFNYILQIHPQLIEDKTVINTVIRHERLDHLDRILSGPNRAAIIEQCAADALTRASVACIKHLHSAGLSLQRIEYRQVIQYAREYEYDMLEYLLDNGRPPSAADACYAIKIGRPDVLQWIIEHGIIPHTDFIEWAASWGEIECMALLIRAGYPMTTIAAELATMSKNAKALDLLLSNGCPSNNSLYGRAKNNRALLQVLHNHKIPCNVDTIRWAATCASLSTLKWYLDNGYGCTKMIDAAAQYGYFDRMCWLCNNGCPWSFKTANNLIEMGLVKYANCLLANR